MSWVCSSFIIAFLFTFFLLVFSRALKWIDCLFRLFNLEWTRLDWKQIIDFVMIRFLDKQDKTKQGKIVESKTTTDLSMLSLKML